MLFTDHDLSPPGSLAVDALSVQIHTTIEELLALRPEWQALEMGCGTDLPFQTWEWISSWWSHLHADRMGVRDALRVCVVRKASGALVGIVPLMLTERPGHGPLRVRTYQFIGADPNITELRLMVCAPGAERDCYAAAMKHLASLAERADWVAWEGLRADNSTLDKLRNRMVCVREKSAFVIYLPRTWALFKLGLGRNIQQSLRHCYNSLKRDALTYRLEVLTGPEEIVAALPDFFRLHSARASVKDAVRHTDVFVTPQAQKFLVDVCQRLATRGVARVFQLWVDDQLVATRIGFVMADTLYLYYSGWNYEYRGYSVMTTLLAEVIRYAIAQELRSVNLSTGNDVSKTRWGAHEVRYAGGRLLSTHRKARVTHLMYQTFARAQTSRFARVLVPAFLMRGPHVVVEPTRRNGSSRLLGLERECGFGAAAAAVATVLAIDLLDGVLDGMLHLVAISGR